MYRTKAPVGNTADSYRTYAYGKNDVRGPEWFIPYPDPIFQTIPDPAINLGRFIKIQQCYEVQLT